MTLGPVLLARGTKDGNDLKQLVLLVSPGEQRPPEVQFRHDATDRENIDRAVILLRFKDKLGCTVPPGANVLGEGSWENL